MLVYPAALSVLEQLVLLIYILCIRSKEGSITKCLQFKFSNVESSFADKDPHPDPDS
jgi:hypothetical protein